MVRLPGGRCIPVVFAAVAILLMVRFEMGMRQTFQGMTSVLQTEKGRLRDTPIGRAEAIRGFLEYIQQGFPHEKPSLVVFPHGVSLNYFAGMKNPIAYYQFAPPEVDSPIVEMKILAELESSQPEFVALTSHDLSMFGPRSFGHDYAKEILAWIREKYSLVRVFQEPTPQSWQLTLLRRVPSESDESRSSVIRDD